MSGADEILKVEFLPGGKVLRYMFGSTCDVLTVPLDRSAEPEHITCTRFPGDTRRHVSRVEELAVIRRWRKEALDVVVVDRRKAVQEVVMPSGLVLTRGSNLLLLAKAYQQYQRGETVLVEGDATALKLWIGDRVPFGMDSVESIKDMKALDGLEEV